MQTANQFLNTAQQFAPVVQQFAPMIQNLPAMWRLYKGFQSLPSARRCRTGAAVHQGASSAAPEPHEAVTRQPVRGFRSKNLPAAQPIIFESYDLTPL